ncbi:[LysW]-aminoadipate kinase [Amycolatopsis magusensis]|uniref:acetylglutamate kinase n=1 Tax=Amycolatopsis magusensis TaxID=882444 RepID=A0ABS4PU29_9PSEU|nr:[LysW]-aminoadipate kinase [Amycolatopsis magusensis]MBP2182939.1 acetylglutamate/LysW-gamma-L-alpha-aminoadipate kinase [Amycolatopsis magusensis]
MLVVKCGGHAEVDPLAVCRDLSGLVRAGEQVVLVHGGSAEVDGLARRLGVPMRRMVAPDGVSARRTDAATLEVLHLALAGAVKPRLVRALAGAGVSAVGLTGVDGGLLLARRKGTHRAVVNGRTVIIRGDHSGRITAVNGRLLRSLLADGHVPVVSPPALAEDGGAVNVDADRVAAMLAAELRATRLVLLTGASGVLADPADERSVRPTLALTGTAGVDGVRAGMAIKLVAAREALLAGVPGVVIADGRSAQPVSAALAGAGTRLTMAPTTMRPAR